MTHVWKNQPTPDAAQHSAAAERNGLPILQVLQGLLPPQGLALEIASGTGQHVALFAAGLPSWVWQPTDAQAEALSSIGFWCAQAGVANVMEPVVLDVLAHRWPSDLAEFTEKFDAVYCANMLHITPWATCAALMQGAARHLGPQGVLITYGPYLERDVPTSPGNMDFDKSLRQRNPAWGIRSLEDVTHQAALAGLCLDERFQMPANNLLLVFRRMSPVAVRTDR